MKFRDQNIQTCVDLSSENEEGAQSSSSVDEFRVEMSWNFVPTRERFNSRDFDSRVSRETMVSLHTKAWNMDEVNERWKFKWPSAIRETTCLLDDIAPH